MYTASRAKGERESWCRDEGRGRETETPVKQESFLARGYTWAIADHRETGGEEEEEEEGETLHQIKKTTT